VPVVRMGQQVTDIGQGLHVRVEGQATLGSAALAWGITATALAASMAASARVFRFMGSPRPGGGQGAAGPLGPIKNWPSPMKIARPPGCGPASLMRARRLGRSMQVTAIQIKALEARRFQDMVPNQQVRIDHNSAISLVVKEAADRMRVEFGYTTSYGPLGVIKVEGLLLLADPNAGAAADGWAATRNLPPEMAQAVHSAILGMAVPEAVGLAKELRLPPPIPIPQVQFQGQAPARKPDQYGSPEVG